MDPILGEVAPPARRQPDSRRVPARLRHLFWNTADSQLDVDHAGAYIARRLLRTMDLQGLAWGAQALAPEDWRHAAGARGLDPKVRQLARSLTEAANVESLDASGLNRPAKPTLAAGLRICSLQDLMAMKLKVMAERGEMRDYFDVKAIDEEGGVSVEEGIELYMRRYRLSPAARRCRTFTKPWAISATSSRTSCSRSGFPSSKPGGVPARRPCSATRTASAEAGESASQALDVRPSQLRRSPFAILIFGEHRLRVLRFPMGKTRSVRGFREQV